MTRLLESLSPAGRYWLSGLARLAEDMEWPVRLARSEGWRVANKAYQAEQRRLGAIEMQALLGHLNLEPPLAPALAREVLLTAIELYLHTEQTVALARLEDGTIRVDVSRCPIFDRFMDVRWYGQTACACFARRKGWYEVLGVRADEELVMTRKRGDPACDLRIRMPAPMTLAAQPGLHISP